MATVYGSAALHLGVFQQELSFDPALDSPSVDSSSSSHSFRIDPFQHLVPPAEQSIGESAAYRSVLSGTALVRASSVHSGDSEEPTPSSSGCEYVPPSSYRSETALRERTMTESDAGSSANVQSGRTKVRRRTTPDQLQILETTFAVKPKPDVSLRKELAGQLDMTPREVQVWFQNRRAKAKKLALRAQQEQEDEEAAQEYEEEGSADTHDGAYHYDPPATSAEQRHPTQHIPVLAGGPSLAAREYSPLHQVPHLHGSGATAAPPLYSQGWQAGRYAFKPTYSALPSTEWASAPTSTGPLEPLLSQVLVTSACDVSPLSTAIPVPGDVSGLSLPLLPRADPFFGESGPSSMSSTFTNFAFGDSGARRDSAASIDSVWTEASSLGTVSGTLTPISMAGSGGSFESLLPPGFDGAARRSSCPAEFIASFQDANLHQLGPNHNTLWMLDPMAMGHNPPSMMTTTTTTTTPASSVPPAVARRHSVAVNPSYGLAAAERAPMSMSGFPNGSLSSPNRAHLARRDTMPGTLDSIDEQHAMLPPSPNGLMGALRRTAAARRSRSQASMRQPLIRPLPTLPGEMGTTSQFDA